MIGLSRKVICEKEKEYFEKRGDYREALAKTLTSLYKKIFNPEEKCINKVIALVEKLKHNKILDVGAGECDICLQMSNKFKIEKYVRSDLSLKRLNKVQGKNIINLVFDGLKHPLRSNMFDIAFSKCVMHHVDNKTKAAREHNRREFLLEQLRMIKKGGKLLCIDICDPTKNGIRGLLWHIIKYRWILGEEKHNFLETADAVTMLNDMGMKNIQQEEVETYKGKYFIVWGEK